MSPLRLVLDTETNGLLFELDRIHCIVLRDIDTGEVYSCADQDGYTPLSTALDLISKATLLIGHNLIGFDIRALRKVYPDLNMRSDCDIFDTLIVSRVLWPELDPVDRQRFSHIEPKYMGRHSLAAWGERLGVAKIKFQENSKKDPDVDNVWDKWSESMQTYCVGDTLVTLELYNYLSAQPLDARCGELEHEFAKVMALQEEFGFPFNERAAYALVNTLKTRRSEIDEQLQAIFPPVREERWSSKTGRRLQDRVHTFNPGSRHQVATRLQERYPEITFEQTEKGNVKLDDDVLEVLGEKYPEAKVLAEYQLLNKRLGQIAEGKEAWLKHCQKYKDGKIHGSVKTNACVSGRCSHVAPNMAQVPSVGHAFGAECRALFYAPDGWRLVGADASGLELRALGAWLAYFDGGEYAKLVSTDGFDIHTHNAKLFGIYDGKGEISKATRNLSKSLVYALCYGAGAIKVGSLLVPDANESILYKKGRNLIDTFYQNLPAIKKLKDLIEQRIDQRGYLTGIDGRRLQIRSKHSALNQLLQSTGAVVMKKATCILYNKIEAANLIHGKDWGFCAFVHDEWQILARPENAEFIAETTTVAIQESAEYFKLLCPFTGEYRIGANWMECH